MIAHDLPFSLGKETRFCIGLVAGALKSNLDCLCCLPFKLDQTVTEEKFAFVFSTMINFSGTVRRLFSLTFGGSCGGE